MGPCKTLNPVIFTFINASDLKFCVRFYSSMMRFEWKSLQNDDVTLKLYNKKIESKIDNFELFLSFEQSC